MGLRAKTSMVCALMHCYVTELRNLKLRNQPAMVWQAFGSNRLLYPLLEDWGGALFLFSKIFLRFFKNRFLNKYHKFCDLHFFCLDWNTVKGTNVMITHVSRVGHTSWLDYYVNVSLVLQYINVFLLSIIFLITIECYFKIIVF